MEEKDVALLGRIQKPLPSCERQYVACMRQSLEIFRMQSFFQFFLLYLAGESLRLNVSAWHLSCCAWLVASIAEFKGDECMRHSALVEIKSKFLVFHTAHPVQALSFRRKDEVLKSEKRSLQSLHATARLFRGSAPSIDYCCKIVLLSERLHE